MDNGRPTEPFFRWHRCGQAAPQRAYAPDGVRFDCTAAPDRLAALAARLRPFAPALIALGATGGYEALVAASLAEARLPDAIVNPRQRRRFAAAAGRLAKTDTIDAAMIAHFAAAIRPPPTPARACSANCKQRSLASNGRSIS